MLKRDAIISDCGKYRYSLYRDLEGPNPPVLFVMLNPSTADAFQDDPTIRRCIGYARDWGHDGLYVGNLFAYRSTDPKQLLKVPDPVGPLNDKHLREMSDQCGLTIAAWGAHGSLMGRDQKVIDMLDVSYSRLHVLRKTKKGYPSHPLYLPKDLKPERMDEI